MIKCVKQITHPKIKNQNILAIVSEVVFGFLSRIVVPKGFHYKYWSILIHTFIAREANSYISNECGIPQTEMNKRIAPIRYSSAINLKF